jgi:hypothetical protein
MLDMSPVTTGADLRLAHQRSGVQRFHSTLQLSTQALLRMLNSHAHQVAVLVEINVNVFADLVRVLDGSVGEFKQRRISASEILDIHGST